MLFEGTVILINILMIKIFLTLKTQRYRNDM